MKTRRLVEGESDRIRFLCDYFHSRKAVLQNLSTRWNRSRRSTSCWLSNIIPTRTKGTKRRNENSSNWRFVSLYHFEIQNRKFLISLYTSLVNVHCPRNFKLKEFDRCRERLIRFLLFLFVFATAREGGSLWPRAEEQIRQMEAQRDRHQL